MSAQGSSPAENDSWSTSVSLRAVSRLSQYGLDAAPERLTWIAAGSIAHEGGFSLGLSSAVQPSPWTVQRTSLTGEYEINLAEAWSLGISLTRSWFPAGSTNPLASSPTSASVSLMYDADPWSFGADVERYVGGEGATYVSVDGSVFLAGDGFSVLPIVSLSFGSQTVTTAALKRNSRGRNTSVLDATTSVTGLSSVDGMVAVIVPLGGGWSASAMPGVSYTPSDLASSSSRLTWSVGLRKSF